MEEKIMRGEMRQFWQGTVSSVYDGHETPELEVKLETWWTLEPAGAAWPVTIPPPQPLLPREGQTYWLIDDETFQKVKNLP